MNDQLAISGPMTDPVDLIPIAYFELNAKAEFVRVNQAACRVVQMDRQTVLGKTIWEFLVPDEVEAVRADFLHALQSDKELAPVRRTLRTARGRFRTYEAFRSVIRDAQETVVGIRYVAVDITDSLVAHSEAHRSRLWLESVLESVGDAVIVTDSLGFVRFVNPAAEALSGWKAEELFGKVVEKGLPLLSYKSAEGTPLNHRAQIERQCKGVATVLTRERKELRVEISTSPVIDKDNGFTIGVVTVIREFKDPC